jgi:hypothetical protein
MKKKAKKIKQSVKLKSLTIPMSPPEVYFKSIQKKIGKKLALAIFHEANRNIKVIDDHFKENKWGLDLSLITSELVGNVFGDIDWYLASRVTYRGYKIKSNIDKNGALLISKK